MKTMVGAIAVAATATTAMAADFPRSNNNYYTAAAPLRSYSWAGPYLGATAGLRMGRGDEQSDQAVRPRGRHRGWLQLAVIGQFVFGGETDIQLSGADDTFAPWKFSNPWFGTLRARGGIAFNNVPLFGTAGLAYGNLRAETAGLTESNTSIGWTAGIGTRSDSRPTGRPRPNGSTSTCPTTAIR